MKQTILIITVLAGLLTFHQGLTHPYIQTVHAEGEEAEAQPTIIPPTIKPDYQPGPTYTEEQRNDKDTYVATAQDWFIKAIARFTSDFIGIVTVLALVMLVLAGVQMLTAYGDEEKITTAKKNATWAVAGLLLAIFSYAIVEVLNYLPFSYPEKEEESQTWLQPTTTLADKIDNHIKHT